MTRFCVKGLVAPACDMSMGTNYPKNVSFEMDIDTRRSSIERHPFASLSTSLRRSEDEARMPGMPLFTLARAAATAAEHHMRVIRVKGDGRCMFRAIALGLARNQGRILGANAEEKEADQLRLAVAEALCRSPKRRADFGEAVMAVQAEDKLQNYCRRIMAPTFWGGEPELLVLSKMLQVPIYVYLSSEEYGVKGPTYQPIQKYGQQFAKPRKGHKARRAVRLLYTGGNHYDLLVKS